MLSIFKNVMTVVGSVAALAALGFGAPATTPAAGAGVQTEMIGRYDLARLNSILTTELVAFTSFQMKYPPPRHAVRLYRVAYPSVIPEKGNRPTVAYGLIAIPEAVTTALPMVSYQHGTVYGKHDVPSFPEQSMETRLMIAQFAGQGYVVIAPDYFGMGLSSECDSYVVKASQQQACLDLYAAARVVLAREQIAMADFFIAGWSQGGFVTMAFLEALERWGVPVRAAATAAAPCDCFALCSRFLSFPRTNDATWLSIVFILSSFSFEEYYDVPGLARALFRPDQYAIARKIALKKSTQTDELPTNLHALIRAEYFNPQYLTASAYGRLMQQTYAFRWLIQTPVRNYYGDADECVTPALAMLPMRYQRSLGNSKVVAVSAGAAADHRGTFAFMVADAQQWFDAQRTR